ncbi:MAG: GGDEF domain-containing protein [Gammaproteobacteria bacterium]|nr:GGDEF domain-containing protein [Gammaproteobacteria bacterium]
MMYEVLLELARALIWLGIFFYLTYLGKTSHLNGQPGYRLITIGFGFLSFAACLDVTDNIEFLSQYVVVGDTPVQAFLEKVVGYLTGSVILFVGALRMFPVFHQLDLSEKQLRYRLYHDRLTDLPNRQKLLDQLEQIKTTGNSGTLLLLKIYDFNTINDSVGPALADQLIQCIAQRLKTHVNKVTTLFRLNGPEFVLLINANEKITTTYVLASAIDTTILPPVSVGGHELRVTLRMSVTFCSHGNDADDLMKQASTALFKAQNSGMENMMFFTREMQNDANKRLALINELHSAVANDEFCLYFQPKMDVHRQLVGAEALIRWIQPQHGMVAPDYFIPLAEESGLINEIGRWVMTDACRKIKQWSKEGLLTKTQVISVNVSPKELLQKDFITSVEHILNNAAIDPRHLCIEITESVLIDDAAGCMQKMKQLKHLGLKLSIDDFGTGYSSLSYLNNLYMDELKIDRCFVKNIGEPGHNTTIVDAIISMAKNLHLDIVVEGVETEQQVDYFAAQDCHTFQGYYFSRPLSPETFYELLKEQSSHNTKPQINKH